MYSGGLSSWYTAKLAIQKYGKENCLLLFTDTMTEDEDLYKFIDQTVNEMNVEFKRLADGRNIWELFKEEKFIGNTKHDICSRVLKRELADRWIKQYWKPDECIIYFGMDWTEIDRYERLVKLRKPYTIKAPLIDTLMSKDDIIAELNGINLPRLYKMGFSHNNCGGFCIKAGQGHFKLLYDKMPEYYRYCEEQEQEVYKIIGFEKPFLRKTIDKKLYYLTLKQFREDYIEKQDDLIGECQIDIFDIGGCNCFS